MAENTPGTQDGQTPEGTTEGTDVTSSPDPEAQDTGTPSAPPAEKTYTEAELNSVAAKARKRAEADTEALKTQLEELQGAEETRRQAEMSEVERAQEAEAKAKADAEAARADADSARLSATRSRIIAETAADLPPAYLGLVGGEDAEAITAAAVDARAQLDADRGSYRDSLLSQIAGMSAEDLEAAFPENTAATALANRFRGQQASIGAPAAAGQTVAAPKPLTPGEPFTLDQWRNHTKKP